MKFLLFSALTAVMAHGYRYYRYDYDYSPYHYISDDYESYGNKYHFYGKRSDEPQVKGRHEQRQKIVRLEEEKIKSGIKEKENEPNGVGYVFENRPVPVTAYPHARVFGELIYLSSISARQLDGTYAGAELQKDGSYKLDIEKQSRAALKGIEETLKNLGAKMENLVDITIYLADIEDLAGFNNVYEEFFPSKEKAPTRGTFAVKNLPSQLALLEIKAIAVVPKTK